MKLNYTYKVCNLPYGHIKSVIYLYGLEWSNERQHQMKARATGGGQQSSTSEKREAHIYSSK